MGLLCDLTTTVKMLVGVLTYIAKNTTVLSFVKPPVGFDVFVCRNLTSTPRVMSLQQQMLRHIPVPGYTTTGQLQTRRYQIGDTKSAIPAP